MKSLSPVLSVVLVICIIGLSACASSKEAKDKPTDLDTITSEDIENEEAKTLSQLIRGRIPGVSIIEGPGGGIMVRIRGRSTFQEDETPLFVVDGMPVRPYNDGSIPGVIVSEIEWVKVHKGPGETARWGMRGAHGVIEVKLKGGLNN